MLLKMLEDHWSGLVWAGFTAIKSYLSANRIHYFHKSTVWCSQNDCHHLMLCKPELGPPLGVTGLY